MVVNKNLLFVILSVIFILIAFVGTASAQREYHLEHEWAKIWINQNGSIDLLYDISITLDWGPNINYVYIGQPKRDFTIGTAMDQYGHTLVASDASSGSDYKVRVNLYDPLVAGETVRFNLTTNVARIIYEDTQNPGNVGMKFIPTWWEEASVLDLQVLIVLPSGVTVDTVIATEELWDGTPLEGDRLSVFWQRANLLPNQKYTFGVSFPKEHIQEYTNGIHILPDGSIDPPTANISTVDYVTYTFVGNIYDNIVIERDNIVVDGAGHTLQAIGAWESPVGIHLYRRSNVTIKNMEIKDFLTSILYDSSDNNEICGNHITNNWDGIRITYSSNNSIHGNNITHNGHGIVFQESSNNIIYHNNLIDNTQQVHCFNSTNTWDKGYPSGGNYWSNYKDRYPNATEVDDSGIWDTPYFIDENNQDKYPIVPEFLLFFSLPLLMGATLLAVIIYRKKEARQG